MIDTDKYENMRQLFLDFIADPMCENDEAAWKRYLNIYDELLAEVKRLRMYEVAWKILYDNAKEEERETRTRTWKEIMELVRSDVREMVDTGDVVFDEWLKGTGGFE